MSIARVSKATSARFSASLRVWDSSMSIRSDLAAMRRLRPLEWHVLLSAMVLMPYVGAALRIRGVNGMLREMGEVQPRARPNLALDGAEIARLVGAVASRRPFRANCLVRSLVLKRVLARRGIAGRLRVGVNTEASEFEAHAWIELGDRPLNDDASVRQRFVPFEGEIAARLFGT
jgi:hypothetical protein